MSCFTLSHPSTFETSAKSVPNFTDVLIKSLPPGVHFDDRTPSFGMRVGKLRRTWLVVKGAKRSKIVVGHYPALSLRDARAKALLVLATPEQTHASIAFPDALDLYLAQPRWRASSRKVMESSLRHFSWKRPIHKITHEDVAQALEAIAGHSARAHALKDIRAFFNWCVPRYLPSSPCVGLRMEKQPSRDRVLSRDELKRVWKAAETMGYPFGTIVRLLILTGQRKTEIGGLQWGQIQKDVVVLAAEATKNGRVHSFPLGTLARRLLPKKGNGYLFRATGSRDVYNGYTFHLKKLQTLSKTKDWTLHDLRRTFATNLAMLGTPIHVTEKLLNHVSGTLSGVAAIYNRHTYAAEMRAAIDTWEAYVAANITGNATLPTAQTGDANPQLSPA